MNYFEYLNKKFETVQGQKVAQNLIKIQPVSNPFAQSVFNGNNGSNVVVNGGSIFEKATKEELNKVDYDKLTSQIDNNNPQKFSPLEFVLKAFSTLDDVKKHADKDGNGEISKEEMEQFVKDLAAKDGNAEELSLEDFEAFLKEHNINLDELVAQAENSVEVNDTATVNEPTPIEAAQSPSGNYLNNKDVVTEFNSVAEKSLDELQGEKANLEKTLAEKQNALNDVYNGNNANIKAAKEDMDKAQQEYEKALSEDKNANAFAPQVLKNNENLAKNEENLDENTKSISDKENEISEANTNLTSLTGELDVLTASLSSLPALSGKEEDKEKDAKITANKSKLEKSIAGKNAEITKQKNNIETLKKALADLNAEKVNLEKERQNLEKEKQDLDNKIQKSCNENTKAKLEAFNNARVKYATVKANELEKAKAEVKKAQESVKEIDKKIEEKKALELAKEYSVEQGGDLKTGLFKGALAGKEDIVNKLCHKYGVEPALVASIIGLESGWGTSNLAKHNNFMGYRKAGDAGVNAKGFGYFSTPEKGLEAAIKNLARYTRFSDVSSVDFNNLDNIGRHYCEGNVWSNRVRTMHNSRVKKYIA